jgi:puromycin-sensitive aminopeptidase
MMETRQCKVTIPNVAAEDWIKLNQGTVGFYRTKYPATMVQQFVPSIEDKSLPPLDRLGILDDLFALVSFNARNVLFMFYI